jgi:hypothetical protein
MRTLAVALIGVALLAGCNAVSGVKEGSRQAADYTYEKKEEYQRALVAQKRELDVKIDELKAKAGRATEAVKSSSASAWNDVKAGANSAMDSVKQTYEKAKARFP